MTQQNTFIPTPTDEEIEQAAPKSTLPPLPPELGQLSPDQTNLPPTCVRDARGRVYRLIQRTSEDGTLWTQRRRVARSLKVARDRRWDFWSQAYGWVLEGYKLGTDRSIQSIMMDENRYADEDEDLEEE